MTHLKLVNLLYATEACCRYSSVIYSRDIRPCFYNCVLRTLNYCIKSSRIIQIQGCTDVLRNVLRQLASFVDVFPCSSWLCNMALDYFAPLIATLFFVTATLAGIYLYCCYFRTSKEESDPEKSANEAHHNYEEGSDVGKPTANFYNYLYPLSMTLPVRVSYDVNVGFPSSPTNDPPVIPEKSAHVLVYPFEERDITKLAHVAVRDRPLPCRRTSNDIKWVSSHCQLHVIQEVNEEEILDGEEANVGA